MAKPEFPDLDTAVGPAAGGINLSVHYGLADMTPEMRGALTEMKRLEHAVPAEQETSRHRLTIAVVAAVSVWMLGLMTVAVWTSNAVMLSGLAWPLAVIVGVLGATPAVRALSKRLKAPST